MAVSLTAGHISAGSRQGDTNRGVQGNYEPQRQNNWYFEVTPPIDGGGDSRKAIELALDIGFLPNESNEPIEVHFVNEKVYIAGKPAYEAGTLTLKDYVDIPVMQAIAAWRQKVYNPLTGAIGLAKDYKVDGSIVLFAGDRTYRREWILRGCWPQAVNYGGTLDMSASDINKIEITLQYDKAIPKMLTGGPGDEA